MKLRNLLVLLAGDMKRLARYYMIAANLVVLVMFAIVALFLKAEEVEPFLPVVLWMDAVVMTVLLVGASIFYEMKEHTVNSMLMAPIGQDAYLLSKVLSSLCNALVTLVFMGVVLFLAKGISFRYFVALPALVVATSFHAVLGIGLTYGAKGFSDIIIRLMLYFVVFGLPPMLASFGVFSSTVQNVFLLLPPGISGQLIKACMDSVPTWQIVAGYIYLPVLGALIYLLFVRPGFSRRIAQETGV